MYLQGAMSRRLISEGRQPKRFRFLHFFDVIRYDVDTSLVPKPFTASLTLAYKSGLDMRVF